MSRSRIACLNGILFCVFSLFLSVCHDVVFVATQHTTLSQKPPAGRSSSNHNIMKPSDMLALRTSANNSHANNHPQHQQPAQPQQQQQQYDFRSVFAEHSARRSPQLTGSNHHHAIEPHGDFGGSNHSVPSLSQHHHQHSSATRSHSSATKAVSHDDVGHHVAAAPTDARPTVPPHSGKGSAATPAVPLHQAPPQQPAAGTKNNRRLGRQESRYTSGNYTCTI